MAYARTKQSEVSNEAPRDFSLTPEELAKFHEQGVIGPFTVYDREWMKQKWRRLRLALMDRENAVYPADTVS
jgi:non-heme Fe2+,alpha-ketoglutarate-dependent halogenase